MDKKTLIILLICLGVLALVIGIDLTADKFSKKTVVIQPVKTSTPKSVSDQVQVKPHQQSKQMPLEIQHDLAPSPPPTSTAPQAAEDEYLSREQIMQEGAYPPAFIPDGPVKRSNTLDLYPKP